MNAPSYDLDEYFEYFVQTSDLSFRATAADLSYARRTDNGIRDEGFDASDPTDFADMILNSLIFGDKIVY